MASYETTISLNQGTAAILQGSQQYSIGLFTGFLVDWTFVHWEVPADHIPLRLARLLLQAGVNGFLLNFLLPWIHPEKLETYRDPTGGYLLAFGLLHGQPNFARDGKELTTALLETYQERFLGKPTPDVDDGKQVSDEPTV